MIVIITHPCNVSLATVTVTSLKMVALVVEHEYLIFCQHHAELFNSRMERYLTFSPSFFFFSSNAFCIGYCNFVFLYSSLMVNYVAFRVREGCKFY